MQVHPMPDTHAGPGPERCAQARVTLRQGHCVEALSEMQPASVHMALTDPPYFLDGLDNDWEKGRGGKRATGTVGGLPVGMKFDARQGEALQKFLNPVAKQLFRVLKPGGFMLMFSAPRLYHRIAAAAEDSGFEIRDQYAWHFTRRAQFKAFSLEHFVQRRQDISQAEKNKIRRNLDGRRTPQLRPQFESILCAQKPRDGTFIDNWLQHGTGLIDPCQSLDGLVPSTVMAVEKPKKESYNRHLTPKPVELCEHLVRLFTKEDQTVLDPFVGSGTTCIASLRAKRHSIGIDINPDYIAIARQRVADVPVPIL